MTDLRGSSHGVSAGWLHARDVQLYCGRRTISRRERPASPAATLIEATRRPHAGAITTTTIRDWFAGRVPATATPASRGEGREHRDVTLTTGGRI